MNEPIRMLGYFLLIKPDLPKEKIGSILVADQAKARPQTAEVILVGPDVKDIAPGDRVFYERLSGHPIKIDEEAFFIIPPMVVYAVIGPDVNVS